MFRQTVAFTFILWALSIGSGYAQQCLHGPGETPDQATRRREALTATRTINNIQFNRPEAARGVFLSHADLAASPFAAKMPESTSDTVRRMSLKPGDEVLPQWKLTLDVTQNGYWFMIKDTSDPCGFAYISNHNGVIFSAEPIR